MSATTPLTRSAPSHTELGKKMPFSNYKNTHKLKITRSPSFGGARQNTVPLNFTASADVPSNSMCHYWCSCLTWPWPNYVHLYQLHPFYALSCSTQLHFAADWKQPMTYVLSIKFIRLVVPDEWVKFRDTRLNRSLYIRPKVVVGAFSTVLWISITANRK